MAERSLSELEQENEKLKRKVARLEKEKKDYLDNIRFLNLFIANDFKHNIDKQPIRKICDEICKGENSPLVRYGDRFICLSIPNFINVYVKREDAIEVNYKTLNSLFVKNEEMEHYDKEYLQNRASEINSALKKN